MEPVSILEPGIAQVLSCARRDSNLHLCIVANALSEISSITSISNCRK
jgi:hypothetical protein